MPTVPSTRCSRSSRRGCGMSSSAKRLPLIVELVGTPGAGKTTLSAELVALLREQGIEAATVLDAAREHAGRTLLGRLADREVCERRVRERGVWPHSRHLSAAELSQYLRNAEAVAGLAVRRARERGWRVVEIDNNDRSPDQIRGELKRALEVPLHGGGGAAHMTNSTRGLHPPRPSRIP